MHALKLILFGVLGALGVLRGVELLVAAGVTTRAILPMAFGILFAALFAREWKTPANKASAS